MNYMKKYLPGYYSVDVKASFDQVLRSIDSLTAVETFDVGKIDEKLKEVLKGDGNFLGWKDIRNSFAAEYVLGMRQYMDSFIFNWTVAYRKMSERGQFSEKEMIEVERNIGIVEKVIW